MIRINLLPQAARPSMVSIARLVMLNTTFVAVVFLACFGLGFYIESNINDQLRQIQNRKEMLKPAQMAMEHSTAAQQKIDARTKLVVQLDAKKNKWQDVLAHIGTITPSTVWLTGFDGKQGYVLIKGNAVDYVDVADMLNQFSVSPMFEEPVLVKTQTSQTMRFMNFEMAAKLKGRVNEDGHNQ